MEIDFVNYNYVGKVDVSKIKETIKSLDKSYWDVYTKTDKAGQQRLAKGQGSARFQISPV
jgi:hypothetical protein